MKVTLLLTQMEKKQTNVPCKECGKLMVRETGYRPRDFCSKECRVNYWKVRRPKKQGIVSEDVYMVNGVEIEKGKAYILKDGKPIELTTPEGIEKLKEVGLIPEQATVTKKEEAPQAKQDDSPPPVKNGKSFRELLNASKNGELTKEELDSELRLATQRGIIKAPQSELIRRKFIPKQ